MSRARYDNGRRYARYATCDSCGGKAAEPRDAAGPEVRWFLAWCDHHDRPGQYDPDRGNAMEPCPGTVTVHVNEEAGGHG